MSQFRNQFNVLQPTLGPNVFSGAVTYNNYGTASNRPRGAFIPMDTGKVLAVGGEPNSICTSASVYTPETNSWAATGSMAVGRQDTKLVALDGGFILAAGGRNAANTAALTSCQLYNPYTGTWAATGNMVTARYNHILIRVSATKVLACGGNTDVQSGYMSANSALCELYDTTTGVWTATGAMAATRQSAMAVLLQNGKVLIMGGKTNYTDVTGTCELYTLSAGTWATAHAMPAVNATGDAALLGDGKVLVCGGYDMWRTQVYNSGTDAWTSYGTSGASSLVYKRQNHCLVTLPAYDQAQTNRKVLMLGGWNATGDFQAYGELWNPLTNTWSAVAQTTVSMSAPGYATPLPDGRVLWCDGNGSQLYY